MPAGDTSLTVDAAIAGALQAHLEESLWVVAFSGGLDSTALLLAASRLVSQLPDAPTLIALHINHGLAEEAAAWEAHCLQLCAKLHIDCQVRRVDVVAAGRGLEAAARGARYAVFRDALQTGGSLLLAHHQDDQVETFFLRLMRGAGVHGLAGMPAERTLGNGRLVRPCLALTRGQLQAYVSAAALDWIEDPSNTDTGYDRNYLRHAVLPLLAQRWPGYRAPVTRAMAHLAELEASGQPPPLQTHYSDFGDAGCDCDPLCRLPLAQAASALRHWLRGHGCQAPPRQPLLEFLRQLRSAGASAAPRLQRRDWCLQRHGSTVYLLPGPSPFVAPPPRAVSDGDCIDVPGVGRVAISSPPGAESPLTLCFRQGGERLCLPGETQHRSLKTLMHAAGVPPWWRGRIPLLFSGDRLLAVGDLWRARDAQSTLVWKRRNSDHPD